MSTAVVPAVENIDPLDLAHRRLLEGMERFVSLPKSEQTEADTRATVIDYVLENVLGWRPGQIQREFQSEPGPMDYKLRAQSHFAVVEAKRGRTSFGLPATDSRWYKRSGATIQSCTEAEEALSQAVSYARSTGSSLTVATTGYEWLVYLAVRVDGVCPEDGYVAVFRSIEDLVEAKSFRLFYELLAERNVRTGRYLLPFYQQEGRVVGASSVKMTRYTDVLERGSDLQRKKSKVAKELEPLLSEIFARLSLATNREALIECFVETRESQAADERLSRLTTELLEDIEVISSERDEDHALTQQVRRAVSESKGRTVLVLGQHGAGKSTFIERFFKVALPQDLRKAVSVVTVDIAEASPDIEGLGAFIRRGVTEALVRELFGDEGPSFEQLKGIFFSAYQKLAKGPLQPLKKSDPVGFDVEFGKRLEALQANESEYLAGLLGFCVRSKRQLPALVLDNVDHFDDRFQAQAFLHAQAVASLGQVLLVLPIRDRTFWKARADGPFHATVAATLYLPRPPVSKVLGKRFDYIKKELSKLEKGERTSIASLKGIRVAIPQADKLFSALQTAFARDKYTASAITALAGGDVREALKLFEQLISSPHISIDRFLSAFVMSGEYRFSRTSFERALILGQWEHYAQERTRFIVNLASCPEGSESSPLLAFRVLHRLYELRTLNAGTPERGFETTDGLLAFFESLGVPRPCTDKTIGRLLMARLVEPYNLSDMGPGFDGETAAEVDRVRLTESGRLHRRWAEDSFSYALLMCEDAQVSDDATTERVKRLFSERERAFGRKDMNLVRQKEREIVASVRQHVIERDAESVNVGDLARDKSLLMQERTPQKLFAWCTGQKFSDSEE